MNLLSQIISKKQIVPTIVKDQNIGLLILFTLTVLSILALYKIMRTYDG